MSRSSKLVFSQILKKMHDSWGEHTQQQRFCDRLATCKLEKRSKRTLGKVGAEPVIFFHNSNLPADRKKTLAVTTCSIPHGADFVQIGIHTPKNF